MAEIYQLRILKKGGRAWNSWRRKNPDILPDLTDTLIKSWVEDYYPFSVDSGFAKKRYNLSNANFKGSKFDRCRLVGSNFTNTNFTNTVFENCDLSEYDFTGSEWSKTILINCSLKNAAGLGNTHHLSPSVLDHMTLSINSELNISFLRGVGLPDSMIDYLPSLVAQPIEFYTCFISYSSRNEDFVKRLHADLQENGVRCWYAPEDMKIGDKMRDAIDQAIRVKEKLLLVLSEDSITSSWVEKEVETAFEEESRSKRLILFPIMIDNYLFETQQSWASDIRRTRHVGNFQDWLEYSSYSNAFERLLRDLRQSAETENR